MRRLLKPLTPSGWTIVAITASVVCFVAWALWAQLDQVIRAPGKAIPMGRVQIIQTVDGGVIEQILVKEGDRVRRGQILVVLDKVKLAASAEEARAKVASLKAQMARIEAELFDQPLRFSADAVAYPNFVANQRLLFAKRRAALQSEIGALHGAQSLMNQELAMNRPLVASGDVARSEIIRMQRGIVDIDGQIAARKARYVQDLQADYTRTESELVSAEQILAQRMDGLKAAEMTAPADGLVKNIRLTTLGAVLRPSDEVLQIVPTGERLIVEAQVAPRDIAFIKPGQSASIKFDAYDSGIYGSALGRVTYISPDTLSEQRPDGSQSVYYRVHLEADIRAMQARKPAEKIEVQPGMTVTAEIKSGQSTVFRYLTKPLLKTTGEAMQER